MLNKLVGNGNEVLRTVTNTFYSQKQKIVIKCKADFSDTTIYNVPKYACTYFQNSTAVHNINVLVLKFDEAVVRRSESCTLRLHFANKCTAYVNHFAFIANKINKR